MATSIETVLMTGEFAPESFGGVLMSGNAFNFLGVPPVVGPDHPANGHPAGRPGRTGRGVESPAVASAVRGEPVSGRPDLAAERPPAHDCRRHAAALRLVWQRAASGFRCRRRGRDVPWIAPDHAPGAGRSNDRCRRATRRAQQSASRRRNPATFPRARLHHGPAELSGRDGRERRDADQPAAAARRRGVPAARLPAPTSPTCSSPAVRARAREMAVRISIGAGRRRLLRQLLTESVLLSLAGGALGVLFAFGAIRSIVGLMPEFYVPNESRVTINMPVLLFSLGVSLLTGIVFGLVPALQTSKPDATDALKAGRSTGAGTHGSRTRNLLVVVEVALSVVLLVSAGLTVRTFFVLQNMDAGINAERVLIVGVPLPPAKYTTLEQRNRFAQELLERVGALPGSKPPRSACRLADRNLLSRSPVRPPDDSRRMTVNLVGPDHLRTFGIPLRSGRMFDASEVRRGDRVARDQRSCGPPLARGRESRSARALRLDVLERPPARTLADTNQPADGHHHRRHRATREMPACAPIRSRRVVMPYSIIAPAPAHARRAQRRGSRTCCSTPCAPRCGRWMRSSRSAVRSRSGNPRAGGRAAAIHDGAVQRVRGARPRARGGWHLQRAVVPRDAAHARTGRAHGARRAAAPRPGPDADDGRTARPRRPWPSVSPRASRRRGSCAASCSASNRPIRSPTRSLPVVLGLGRARRLLHSGAAGGRRRSDGGAPAGVSHVLRATGCKLTCFVLTSWVLTCCSRYVRTCSRTSSMLISAVIV